MTGRAVLVRRDGDDAPRPTPSFAAVVEGLGLEVVASVGERRREHGRYGVGPGLVDRVETRCRDHDAGTVAVDGHLHEGQVVDLSDALSVAVRDRRDVVWGRLAADGNDAAATRGDLRATRVDRRRAASAEGESAGRTADLDRRCDETEAALERDRTAARQAVETAHVGVDAHVAVVGPVDAPTTRVWAGLVGREAASEPFTPGTPTTETTRLGPHGVAVTDGPGLLDGDAEWYERVVPGWLAAVDRATVVVAVDAGTRPDDALAGLAPRSDTPRLTVGTADDPGALREDVAGLLPTARLAVRLPYADAAHATVSWLHERGVVESTDYGDEVCVEVVVPAAATATVRDRVETAGGSVRAAE